MQHIFRYAVFLYFFAVSYAFSTDETDLESLNSFLDYMVTYNKPYQSVPPQNPLWQKRYHAYRKNYYRVKSHNKLYDEGFSTFTLGINHLADLTDEEYRNLVLGYKLNRRIHPTSQMGNLVVGDLSNVPETWDWREHNAVTPVKNQGMCGSCWAFASICSLESAYARATGKLFSLSEQELIDCAANGTDTCTRGGEMKDAFEEIIQRHAGKIEKEADYNYTAVSLGVCKANDKKGIGHFTAYHNVTSENETELLYSVYQHGAVAVAIDASSFMFQLYRHGVFNWPLCGKKFSDLDHGVAVVGYGAYMKNRAEHPYWLVKNSWGEGWGMQGYIMMSRNKNNQCGIATDASFPIMTKEG